MNFSYLYQDADGYTFMNSETYDQIIVPPDVIGDQSQWLQEGMTCVLSIFNGIAVGIRFRRGSRSKSSRPNPP